MKVLGIRCSNKDYAYCILTGTQDAPIVEDAKQVAFPADFSEHEALRWFYQELQAIFEARNIDIVGIKKAETQVRRTNSLDLRIQNEGIVALAASEAGCSSFCKKVKSTIAKDLGLKGKGKYLETELDTSALEDFDEQPKKIQEAILTAWSCLS